MDSAEGLVVVVVFPIPVKSSQVLNPHKSKSSQSSTGKSSVCMTGFVLLLLRFSAFGWADVRIMPLSFLSLIVAAFVCVCVSDQRKKENDASKRIIGVSFHLSLPLQS